VLTDQRPVGNVKKQKREPDRASGARWTIIAAATAGSYAHQEKRGKHASSSEVLKS
jgi:hypothetical protein